MLRTSLGFHTLSLILPINVDDVYLLIHDFLVYSHATGKIKMCHTYKKDGRVVSEPFRVRDDGTFLLPLKTTVTYRTDTGVSWEIHSRTNDPLYKSYYIVSVINPKLLAGISDYITASNLNNMDAAIREFDLEAKRISPILKDFKSYHISRIDYCVNFSLAELVPMCTREQIMCLIKRSNIPNAYTEWTEYDPVAHRQKSKLSSFYLMGNYVNINCYSKYMQLEEKSKENQKRGYSPIPLEVMENASDIIRFEVQCKYLRTYTLTQKALQDLPGGIDVYKILLCHMTCIDQIEIYYSKTIGKADWYTLQDGIKKIKSHNFNYQKEKRLVEALQVVNQCRSVAKAKELYQGAELTAFKRTLKELSSMGINPVTIPKEWGIKHIPNLLYVYFDKVQADRQHEEMKAMFDKLVLEEMGMGS